MAKHGYEAMLLPGEELMYKIQGVYDISQHYINAIGTLYITTFQSFFVDDAKEQLKYTVPHGCIASVKKFKNQNTNNVPLTDKAQYVELRCKDLRAIKFILPTSARPTEVRRYLEFIALPENITDSYAFTYNPLVAALDEGWHAYNPLEEYKRIGLTNDPSWRVSDINENFILCPTYPESLVVPASISDKVLEKVGDYRSKARIPVCVWKHPTTQGSISRCSQPLVGLGRRSEDDELLLRELQRANQIPGAMDKPFYIIDARPKVNAAACTLSGGGTEVMGHYTEAHANLEYCGIANIHVVRESFKKLGKVCRTWDKKSKWSDVTATHWLEHISSILSAACRIVTYVDTDGSSALVHCTDGWDRTSQLCALAELMMDPFYRTIHGFVTLICKEFISFGHKFSTRNGNVSYHPRSQGAPIFVQFLDCVWQLTRQFPTSFEFSENLLILIITHLHSQLFGTFLCDNEAERHTANLMAQSGSLWGLILHAPPAVAITITNPMYTPHPGTLHGNGNVNGMQLWRGYYTRCSLGGLDESQAKKEKKKEKKEKKEKKDKKEGQENHNGHPEDHHSEDSKEDEENKNKESKENGSASSANGTHAANGDETPLDPITLHEAALIPYLDTLNEEERAKMRKDLKVWLAMGGGRAREKARLQLAPRKPLERKESRFGNMRVSSHHNKKDKDKDKHNEHHEHDEEESEGEEGIKRGKSFSSVFARMTGTLRGDKGRTRAGSSAGNSDQESHEDPNSSNNNNNNNNGSNSSADSPNPINNRSNLTEDDPET